MPNIKKIVRKINELRVLAGSKPKRTVVTEQIDPALATQVKALVAQGIRDAIMIPNKTARQERLDQLKDEAVEKLRTPDDPNREPLNMHFPPGSPEFFAGNGQFLTKKLWGLANEPPFFHHGQFTTMREAIEAHRGDAEAQRQAWESLSDYGRNAVIEFLKTLQVLPPGTRHRIVDERGNPRQWDSPLGDGT